MGKRGKMPKAKLSVGEVAEAKSTTKDTSEDMRWKAEDALRTLSRAHEIQEDKELMKHVKKCAQEQMDNLSKLAK